MKKQIATTLVALVVAGVIVLPAFADNDATSGGARNARMQIRNELRQNSQNRKDLLQDLRNVGLMFGRLFHATVNSISGTTLNVTANNGKPYTILTDGTTIFRRHFWGKSSLSEISVNDKLNIWGKFTDSTKTTIQAHMIRDLSIMKRFGTFFGTVSAINGSTITLNTVNRGTQTVTFDSKTKCVQRNMQSMTCGSIQVGQRIRVKGMWDVVNKTVTEVTQIKDFSVPAHPSGTPTPTP